MDFMNYLFRIPKALLGTCSSASPVEFGFSRDRRSFRTPRLRLRDETSRRGDLDDGLPRGFLAGAVVEMWLALQPPLGLMNFPLARGEERPNL